MNNLVKFHPFKNKINEDLIGDIIKSSKGSLKNLFNSMSKSFKSLVTDFKSGLKFENLKTEFLNKIDTLFKNTSSEIQKSKDESEINSIIDIFVREIVILESNLEKSLKSLKENNETNNEMIRNSMIIGKVMLGMVRDQFQKLKSDFDKKYKSAKDLSAKKLIAIQLLKDTIDKSKKKINDQKSINDAIQSYKSEYKDDDIKLSSVLLNTYGVKNISDLVGKKVRYKTDKYIDSKDSDTQPKNIRSLNVLKIENDGILFKGKNGNFKKSFNQILPSSNNQSSVEKTKEILGRIKGDTQKMNKIAKFIEFIDTNYDKNKLDDIEKIIGN